MGKYDKHIIEMILFFKQHYYLLLWSIHIIYNATLKIFKIYDSTAVDSIDDEMDY